MIESIKLKLGSSVFFSSLFTWPFVNAKSMQLLMRKKNLCSIKIKKKKNSKTNQMISIWRKPKVFFFLNHFIDFHFFLCIISFIFFDWIVFENCIGLVCVCVCMDLCLFLISLFRSIDDLSSDLTSGIFSMLHLAILWWLTQPISWLWFH